MSCCTGKAFRSVNRAVVGTPFLEWHSLCSKNNMKMQVLSRAVMVLIFPSLNRKRIGRRAVSQNVSSHNLLPCDVLYGQGLAHGGECQLEPHFPPPLPHDYGQLQAKKIFVSSKFICFPCQDHNSSFVTSPWTTVGVLGCHKQRILSQTRDSGSRVGKKEKKPKRPPFETKLLPMQSSKNVTRGRIAFQTHTHTQNKVWTALQRHCGY